MSGLRFPGIGACVAVALASGCITDHDALARKPKEKPADAAADSALGTSDAPGSQGDARPSEPSEAAPPGGSTTLTVLHGIADETGRIAFCFGAGRAFAGAPLPEGGLAYGHSFVLRDLPILGSDLDEVRMVLLAGDLTQLAGLDCDRAIERARSLSVPPADEGTDAEAGPGVSDAMVPRDAGSSRDAGPLEAGLPQRPAVRVVELPVIPAASLSKTESYLLALYGCIGGLDPAEGALCGTAHTPSNPSLFPSFVRLAREAPRGAVGLQFVNACAALSAADLLVLPPEESTAEPYSIARSVVVGQIAPSLPRGDRDAFLLGVTGDQGRIEIYSAGSALPLYSKPWSSTLALSGIPTLEGGKSYTLVLTGPRPGFEDQRSWNDPGVTVVVNDP